jgi:Niemann-Pick C1 protein
MLHSTWHPDTSAAATRWSPASPSSPPEQPGGILQREYLLNALHLQQVLEEGVAGDGTRLQDVCFRPITGRGCLVESPLDYFGSNASVLQRLSPADIQYALQCQLPVTAGPSLGPVLPCMSRIGTPIQRDVVLGGMRCLTHQPPGFNVSVCGECGTHADALILTFLLRDDGGYAQRGARWEGDVFLPRLRAWAEAHPALRVTYMAQRSIQDELAIVTHQNAWVVALSYLAMFLYVAAALGTLPTPSSTTSRVGLAALGMIVVAASTAAAIGAVSYAGMHVSMIVLEVVPFLILAIGVDNMFLLAQAFDVQRQRQHCQAYACNELGWPETVATMPSVALSGSEPSTLTAGLLVEHRPAHAAQPVVPTPTCRPPMHNDACRALQLAADDALPAICAAALCETLAFAVGAIIPVPAVRQFCVVSAVAVVANAALQATWFVPALAADSRRQADGRADLWPCRRAAPTERQQPQGRWARCSVTGAVRGCMRRCYAPLLLSKGGAAVTGALAACVLCAGVLGTMQLPLHLGLDQRVALPSSSYLADYFGDQAAFAEAGPPLYIVLQGVNYTHPAAASAMSHIVEGVASMGQWVSPPVSSWFADFTTTWATPATRAMIIAKRAADPQFDCPVPLAEGNHSFAQRVWQYVAGVPINSTCCQQYGFCGAQYSMDVTFTWARANGSAVDACAGPSSRERATVASAVGYWQPEGGSAELAGFGSERPEPVAAIGTAPWVPCTVSTTRLRTQHTPLRTQSDFVGAMQDTRSVVAQLQQALPVAQAAPATATAASAAAALASAAACHAPGGAAFPQSLFYAFYGQYETVRGAALQNGVLALAAVFMVVAAVKGVGPAAVTVLGVAYVLLATLGGLWLWNLATPAPHVEMNAVLAVNLVAAVGLAVEFCVHMAASAADATGRVVEPAAAKAGLAAALLSTGTSILTGITATKLVGVAVLAWAPSALFRLYYFRVYACVLASGAFVGLGVLPVSVWAVQQARCRRTTA